MDTLRTGFLNASQDRFSVGANFLSIAGRIRTLVDENADGNISKFAKLIGVRPSNVKGWLSGDYRPGRRAISQMAKSLGRDEAEFTRWILFGDEPTPAITPAIAPAWPNYAETPPKGEPGGTIFMLPVITEALAAMTPHALSDGDVLSWVPTIYNEDWCPHPENTVCVRVSGDSMSPTIPSNSIVAIDFEERDRLRLRGNIIALRHAGGISVKRLFYTPDGVWAARPDNPQSADIIVIQDADFDERLVGRVVWWWSQIPLNMDKRK